MNSLNGNILLMQILNYKSTTFSKQRSRKKMCLGRVDFLSELKKLVMALVAFAFGTSSSSSNRILSAFASRIFSDVDQLKRTCKTKSIEIKKKL